MRLHCRTHGLFLDIDGNRRTFRANLAPQRRNEHGVNVADEMRLYRCAMYWHPSPMPGTVHHTRNGRNLGPCEVTQVV